MDTIGEELIISNDMNKIVSYQKIHFWKFEKLKYRCSLSKAIYCA